MLIKMIQNAVKNWGAPKNWTKENGICGGLPTTYVVQNGIGFWVSAWEPEPHELEMLNAGGTIHLWVSSDQHPVVALSVNPLVEN